MSPPGTTGQASAKKQTKAKKMHNFTYCKFKLEKAVQKRNKNVKAIFYGGAFERIRVTNFILDERLPKL